MLRLRRRGLGGALAHGCRRWLRGAATTSWHWGTASSAALDLDDAVKECVGQLAAQRQGASDLLIVHASGHRSTAGIRRLFADHGAEARVFFGSATRFGPIEARLASGPALAASPGAAAMAEAVRESAGAAVAEAGEGSATAAPGARLTVTAAVLPGVEVTAFHCAEEALPELGPTFDWEGMQREAGNGEASLLLLQANRYCFDEEQWLRVLDVAFPFTPKVGHAFGSRTGQAERRMCRADAEEAQAQLSPVSTPAADGEEATEERMSLAAAVGRVNASVCRMKREVMFLNDRREYTGATGLLLRGALDVSCFAASSLRRLGPALTVTELHQGGVFSLNDTFVWSALSRHLEAHGVGEQRASVFAAVVRRANLGGGRRHDPSPAPYRELVYRAVDWASHETALYLEEEELAVGDQLQLFRCDLGRGANDMRRLLSAFEESAAGAAQLQLLSKGQGGSLAFTSLLTPDISNYFFLSNYRQLLESRMEDVDEELAREVGAAQRGAMLAAGMANLRSGETSESGEDEGDDGNEEDGEAQDGTGPLVVISPGKEGEQGGAVMVLDASQLQEQTFPQRLAAARRAARAKEILAASKDRCEGSDVEVAEEEELFFSSGPDEEEEALERRLEASLRELSAEDCQQVAAARPAGAVIEAEPLSGDDPLEEEVVEPLGVRIAECSDAQLATGSYGLGCFVPVRRRKGSSVKSLPLMHSTTVVVLTPSAPAKRPRRKLR